jgi:uncharacterized phage protein (TIGR02218 family)
MSISTYEQSKDRGQPIGLISFEYGTAGTQILRYTDYHSPITFNGDVYEPMPSKVGAMKAKGTLDRESFKINLPADAAICQMYYRRPPNTPVVVKVYYGHFGDDDFKVYWVGRVQAVELSGVEATLSCEPATISLNRTGLRLRWSFGCPHVLYGSSCGVTANWIDKTITNISPYIITVDGSLADPTHYVGGVARWTMADGYAYANILRVDGEDIYLNRKVVSTATTLTVAKGCQKTIDFCRDVFNNIQNFGGCAYIPTKNPVMHNIGLY